MKNLLTEKNFMWLAIIACAVLSLTKAFHKGRQVERKRMAPIQKHWDQEERGMQIERRERMKQRGNKNLTPKQRKAAKELSELSEEGMMQFYRAQESDEHTRANEARFGAHDFFLGKNGKQNGSD
tara:strand:- start:427 stop:801 length:375 start_codon:yes stop_codon:yes gene_type:complete